MTPAEVLAELVDDLEGGAHHMMICPSCKGRGAVCRCPRSQRGVGFGRLAYCKRPAHRCPTCPGGGEIPVREWVALKLEQSPVERAAGGVR
jgi:hypothetical protein